MGWDVARGHPAPRRFNAAHSEVGGPWFGEGLQNQAPCAARARTAAPGSELAQLQATSHCDISGVRGTVAEGRTNSVQTIDRSSRSISD